MNEIITGDCLDVLRGMPDESVHCVVTSPPYWNLRDYGVEGQLGLEATPEEYLARMVEVFHEVRRVLRTDGTCWVNMGDSYASGHSECAVIPEEHRPTKRKPGARGGRRPQEWAGRAPNGEHTGVGAYRNRTGFNVTAPGLKPKDLCMMPHRLAIALQEDGWWVRMDIVWSKKNPMPESCTDRPTKSHEYIFLLTKAARYWYDADAVREIQGNEMDAEEYEKLKGEKTWASGLLAKGNTNPGYVSGKSPPGGRNRRSVWEIATQPFPEAHFATFPEKLVEPCIKAGCPHKVCAVCGAPWVRVVERDADWREDTAGVYKTQTDKGGMVKTGYGETGMGGGPARQAWLNAHPKKTLGFHPTCTCSAATEPGVVLDPFMGSGTVALVAIKLNRRYLGIELSEEYAEMARKRLRESMPLFA